MPATTRVPLLAEANVDGLAVASIVLQAGTAGGVEDRVAQVLRGDPRRRAPWRDRRRVEAHDRVEVHQPTGLNSATFA
jgi:hypothetical protein